MTGVLKFRNQHGQWQEFRAARGMRGPEGPPGPPGTGVEIQGVVTTEADLPASGDPGHAWMVTAPTEDYYGIVTDRPILFVWDVVDTAWVPAGPLQGERGPKGDPGEKGDPGPPGNPATATPLAPAGGTNGTSPNAARQDHTHAGTYANLAHTHTSSDIVGVLETTQVPGLDASKVISGTFSINRLPNIDAAKIISGKLNRDRIPNLTADIIVGGTFLEGLIPNLNANKITAGTMSIARLPVGTTSGTVAAGDHKHDRLNLFNYTHRAGSNNPTLRVGPSYDHAVIAALPTNHALCDMGMTPIASGGDNWRYVFTQNYGFGWVPWIGMSSI